MSYYFRRAQKKISIDDDDINTILMILTKVLEQNAGIKVVANEEYQKNGIWYSLVVKKLEDMTGGKHGSTMKLLPEVNIRLDSFASNLLERFKFYLTKLLKEQKIISDKIIPEVIVDKFVLVREILLRLIPHALSADRNDHREGEKILEATKEFIKQLNEKELLFNKPTIGKIETTVFSNSLASEKDYWFKLMANSVKVTDLLHKNTHACSNCFQLLRSLKLITLRQLTVLLDSTRELSDYHDELIFITFEACLKEKKIDPIQAMIQTESMNTRASSILSSIENQLNSIYSYLDNSELKSNKYLPAIKEHFQYLIKINISEKVLDKMSIIITALSWFPVITGTLEFKGFSKYLSDLIHEATTILNANQIGIANLGSVILQKYNSMSAGDINLTKGFDLISEQLDDLSNRETINQLLKLVGYTATDLITLQKELGIVVINEDKLLKLCQSLTPNVDSNLPSTASLVNSNSIVVTNKIISSNPKTGFFKDGSNPSNHQPLMIETNSGSSYQSQNLSITTSTTHYPVQTIQPQKICVLKTNNNAVSEPQTYVITKQKNSWSLIYCENTKDNPKTIDIFSIKGLNQALMEIDEIDDGHFVKLQKLIFSHHVKEKLKNLTDEKKYKEGLQYIEIQQGFISQDTWLSEYSSLCKANFYLKLANEELNTLTHQEYNVDTIQVRKQAENLKSEIKQTGDKLDVTAVKINDKNNAEYNSKDSCTLC